MKRAGTVAWTLMRRHPLLGAAAAGAAGIAAAGALGAAELGAGAAVAYGAFQVLTGRERPDQAFEEMVRRPP